ncbi:DNA-binding transcriptional MerR regulator [Pseudonocardia hierapolitana]|uniref:DNA-binding transcriptional MerR regulator n=1 Tax=Pseudonocardia hierapolitana TaxID=1128676 RepID=A0A561SUY9_9PSEU|nr:MerR family transcriptional regulator [Pseudonocardia hierapolitana]TWF78680.1 DNA-binding transcriptional MerR regulator [Pseudonocardia hierapolitana]
MTQDTAELGIGDLAALTGVPVRTIRFYCDEGLLDSRRSAGGHRRFAPSAVERLDLVRRLRGLGLGLPAIAAVLTGERSIGEAVAAERAALDVELAALAWRRASLRAVEEAGPIERAARLELLGAVQDHMTARAALVDFWHHLFIAPLPADLVDMFLEVSVPAPPADPTPRQVVAYAEMVGLTRDRTLVRRMRERARVNLERMSDEAELLMGIGEACELARPLLLAGRPPAPGPALDRYVAAYATVQRSRDTTRFRHDLLTTATVDRDPRLRRYWRLVGEVTGEPVTVGGAQAWLVDALERSIA